MREETGKIFDMPEKEIMIGSIRLTLVHPDMVRLYDEETAEAVTMKEWQVEKDLEVLMESAR